MRADLRVIDSLDAETVTVTVTCVACGKPAIVRGIPAQPFAEWFNGGAAIQDALPMLTADDREVLVSGTHGNCFDNLFAAQREA